MSSSMKRNRSIEKIEPTGFKAKWTQFWFEPRHPLGLHILRVLACCLFLAWLLPVALAPADYFGLNGWVDLQAYKDTQGLEEGPPAPYSWSIFYLAGQNISLVTTLYWCSIGAIVLFALGIATRLTSILTWIVIVSSSADPIMTGEFDVLAVILSFYLMIGYVLFGQWRQNVSWFERIVGSRETWLFYGTSSKETKSIGANIAVRLIQIHMALVICVSGLHKLNFPQWWGGVAFWYSFHPAKEATVEGIRKAITDTESYFFWMSLTTYIALIWQVGFPTFAWRRGLWRLLLLGGAVVSIFGSWYLYERPYFGAVIALGCLSYLRNEEWRWAFGLISKNRAIEEVERSVSATPTHQRADYAIKA